MAKALKILLFAAAGVNILRLAIVGFTVFYQWQGRDYQLFISRLRESVPADARVICASPSWFALAGQRPFLAIYSQGNLYTDFEVNERNWFDNPANLDRINCLVIQKSFWMENRFTRINAYLNDTFVLEKSLRFPFQKLPWAKVCNLDVDIYLRRDRLQGK